MSDDNVIGSVNAQSTTPMGVLAKVSLVFTVMVLVVVLCLGIHAGVDVVYDYVEDKCFIGVCVDRQPQAP